jgi:hypothetical protein
MTCQIVFRSQNPVFRMGGDCSCQWRADDDREGRGPRILKKRREEPSFARKLRRVEVGKGDLGSVHKWEKVGRWWQDEPALPTFSHKIRRKLLISRIWAQSEFFVRDLNRQIPGRGVMPVAGSPGMPGTLWKTPVPRVGLVRTYAGKITDCLASQARHELDAQMGRSLARNVVAIVRIVTGGTNF